MSIFFGYGLLATASLFITHILIQRYIIKGIVVSLLKSEYIELWELSGSPKAWTFDDDSYCVLNLAGTGLYEEYKSNNPKDNIFKLIDCMLLLQNVGAWIACLMSFFCIGFIICRIYENYF